MFERSRVDNMVQGQQVAVPAEVTLVDGETLKGQFLLPASRPVHEVLNGAGAFLEFHPYGAETILIAKSCMRAIRLVSVPTAGQLKSQRNGEAFDPHVVLGVPAGAGQELIRKAYHELAKVYHPDRYATAELPPEVREYLGNMVRRINLAFQALERTEITAKVRSESRAQPIYTSGQRL